jgi:hypothetical protein|nr:MAG TPA: hypothetical protein [Caudoviricetes sp.]
MELKDFIKGVVFDISNAIEECQKELKNGTIVSPTNSKAEEKIRSQRGDLKISYIDFEVAVSAKSEIGKSEEGRSGIEVSGSVFGFNVGGKLGGSINNEDNKQVNENLSKIKFSIPIVYPTVTVNERSALRASLPQSY